MLGCWLTGVQAPTHQSTHQCERDISRCVPPLTSKSDKCWALALHSRSHTIHCRVLLAVRRRKLRSEEACNHAPLLLHSTLDVEGRSPRAIPLAKPFLIHEKS